MAHKNPALNPAGRAGKPIILPPTTFEDAGKMMLNTAAPHGRGDGCNTSTTCARNSRTNACYCPDVVSAEKAAPAASCRTEARDARLAVGEPTTLIDDYLTTGRGRSRHSCNERRSTTASSSSSSRTIQSELGKSFRGVSNQCRNGLAYY
jgi:hypothetical protein